MQGTQVPSLGWEDPLEEEMAMHSAILAWKIPWTEEPGGLQSRGSQSRKQLSQQHTQAHLQPTPTPTQVQCDPRPKLGFTSSLCHSLTWITILLLGTSVCPSVKWEWCPCFRVVGEVSEST